MSHVRNRLSVQSTRALLCLGVWSEMGYVRTEDIKAATVLPEVGLDEVEDLQRIGIVYNLIGQFR